MNNKIGKNNPMYKHGKTKTRLYEIWRAMKKTEKIQKTEVKNVCRH